MKKRPIKTEKPKPTTDKSYTGRQKKVVKTSSDDSSENAKPKRPRIKKAKEDSDIGFRQNNRRRGASSANDASAEKKKINKPFKSSSSSSFKRRDVENNSGNNFKSKEKNYSYKRRPEKNEEETPNTKKLSNSKSTPFKRRDSENNSGDNFKSKEKNFSFKKRSEKNYDDTSERNFKDKPITGKEGHKGKFRKGSETSDKISRENSGTRSAEEREKVAPRKLSRSESRIKEGPKKSYKKEFKRGPEEEVEKGETKFPRKTSKFDKSRDLKKEPPVYKNLKPKNLPPQKEKNSSGDVRLNRYIANAGICSRREADELISSGLIRVNDKVITEMGFKVKPGDVVKYEKRVLKREKLVYVLLNKPKDFITTTDDPEERRTVMDLVKNACDERIYPVGRLDRNTTGLLLLTNDGDLADKLSHPSNEVKKVYQVLLNKSLTPEDFEKIKEGVVLEDGKADVDDLSTITPDATVIGIELHLGRNRIVRRIFEHLGYDVLGLDRVVYSGLTKKDLPRGHWRYLTEKEVIQLKHFS